MQTIAEAVRTRRLSLNLTQMGLQQRSGVSLGTIKKFEHSGKISLESLLQLAIALGATKGFESLFAHAASPEFRSIEDLLKEPKIRKRGRVT